MGARLDRRCHCRANLVEQFADDGFFFFGQSHHLLAPGRNAAAAPEIFYARGLERLLVASGFDLTQRVVAQLFQRMSHRLRDFRQNEQNETE